MRTHDRLVKKLLKRSVDRAEVECIEREESTLLDALLKARRKAVCSARRRLPRHGLPSLPPWPAWSRALATGRDSPSIATVRKYEKACGKPLRFQVA